jgi:hypothetical protein
MSFEGMFLQLAVVTDADFRAAEWHCSPADES